MSSTRSRPTRQPVGWMMLNRNTSVSVNAAWPAAKEIAAGATPANRIATGSRNHSSVALVPITSSSAAPIDEPGHRAQQSAQRRLTGAQRVRAQHRQRAQHHPEGVLHARAIGDEHRQCQADRRRARCCAATPSCDPRAPSRAAGPRSTSRRCPPAGGREPDPASCAAPPPPSGRCCGRSRDREAQLLRAEARVERRELAERADGPSRRLPRQASVVRSPPGSRAVARAQRFGASPPVASSSSAPRSSTVAAATLTAHAAWSAGRSFDRRRGWIDDRVQPVQLVDQAHDRPRGGAQARRSIGRRQEPPRGSTIASCACATASSRSAAKAVVAPAQHVGDLRAQPRRERSAGARRRRTQRAAHGRRPQHPHGEQRSARRHRPSPRGGRGSRRPAR